MAAVGAPGALVLEKMPRIGRKIMITGKGRCNFTNVKPWQDFSLHVHPKANALRSAFHALTPEHLMEMFAQAGLECIVERGERAFPASHRAVDVVDTLERMVRRCGSSIRCNCAVTSIEKSAEGFVLGTSTGDRYACKRLIITCGGLSYPTTGSDGDGLKFASALGHTVTRTYPSLTALVPKGYKEPSHVTGPLKKHIPRETPLASLGSRLCGRSNKNVSVRLFIDGALVQEDFGDVDFTDGGLEGPMGFKMSRRAVIALENGSKAAVELAFKDGEKQRYDIEGFVGYERCVVTAGGVSIDEIIPKTMASRIVEGLYFAGEVLDMDADTGGYNLHIAFCTGYLAGEAAANSL